MSALKSRRFFSGWLRKRRKSEVGSTGSFSVDVLLCCWLCRWRRPSVKNTSSLQGWDGSRLTARKEKGTLLDSHRNRILPITESGWKRVLPQSLQMRREKLESRWAGSHWSPLFLRNKDTDLKALGGTAGSLEFWAATRSIVQQYGCHCGGAPAPPAWPGGLDWGLTFQISLCIGFWLDQGGPSLFYSLRIWWHEDLASCE